MFTNENTQFLLIKPPLQAYSVRMKVLSGSLYFVFTRQP